MINGLIPLVLLGLIVWGAISVARRIGPVVHGGGFVRAVVSALFLLAALVVAAIGVADLIGLALPQDVIASSDSRLARALAMTLVGAPVAVLAWRFYTQRIHETAADELVWPVYLTIITLVFGIGGVVGLANGLRWVFGVEGGTPETLAVGVVWGVVWVFHDRLRRTRLQPITLIEVPTIAGSLIGLVTAAVASGVFVAIVLEELWGTWSDNVIASSDFGDDVLTTVFWLVVGVVVWWWQWTRDARTRSRSTVRIVYLIVGPVLTGAVAAVSGAIGLGTLGLSWLMDSNREVAWRHFSDAPGLIAALGVGVGVWWYHRGVLFGEPSPPSTAFRYVMSGLGLVVLGSGVGVTVNILIGAFSTSIVDESRFELLGAGLSALLVGGPIWWFTWRPFVSVDADELGSTPRRVYLTVLAGVGGFAALIALVLIVTRVFESVLDDQAGLIEGIRAPAGTLVATGLVGAYHWLLWRRERGQLPDLKKPDIESVSVLGRLPGSAAAELRRAVDVPIRTILPTSELVDTDAEHLTAAVVDLETPHVLVIVEGDRLQVCAVSAPMESSERVDATT